MDSILLFNEKPPELRFKLKLRVPTLAIRRLIQAQCVPPPRKKLLLRNYRKAERDQLLKEQRAFAAAQEELELSAKRGKQKSTPRSAASANSVSPAALKVALTAENALRVGTSRLHTGGPSATSTPLPSPANNYRSSSMKSAEFIKMEELEKKKSELESKLKKLNKQRHKHFLQLKLILKASRPNSMLMEKHTNS